MIGGLSIVPPPPENPERAEDAGGEKGGTPSEADCHPRHDERRENGSDICAGVEDARRQGTLTLRKPFGDGFDGCGKIAGLSDTETEARETKLKSGVG